MSHDDLDPSGRGIRVDLERAEISPDIEAVALGRLARAISVRRGEAPVRRVTIRSTDVAVVALMVGRDERLVRERVRLGGILDTGILDTGISSRPAGRQRTVGTGTGTMKRPPPRSYSAC